MAGQVGIKTKWTTTSYTDPTGLPTPFVNTPVAFFKKTVPEVAIFLGHNWWPSPKLFVGVEGQVGASDAKTTHIIIPGVFDLPPSFTSLTIHSKQSANVRARLGYSLEGSFMIYGGIGAALLKTETSAICPSDGEFCNPVAPNQRNTESKTLRGLSLAAGLEHYVSEKALLRLEYSRNQYGASNFSGLTASPDSFGFTARTHYTTNSLKFGIGTVFS